MYRRSNLYNPKSKFPFRVSRSKIDLFIQCPRCFYLDRRLGISRPSIPAFTLNSAVDALLKKEFDLLRKRSQAHEIMKQYGIKAIPFSHPDIDEWRNNFKGKEYHHEGTNFIIFGAVDDIWENKKGEIIIVDYKATSTEREISLDDKWKMVFKRQIEIYQWIYKMSGFKVSKTGYIVYANAGRNKPKFDAKLEFRLTLHPHTGETSWVEPVLYEMKEVLDSNNVPKASGSCEHCSFVNSSKNII